MLSGLSKEYYVSNEIFKREDKVFKNNWVFACHLSDIKNDGDYVLKQIFNNSIIIINNEHSICAMSNICLHRGTPLIGKQKGNVTDIVCPYHSWRYRKDGLLVKDSGNENTSLKKFCVKVLDGFIFINISNILIEDKIQDEFAAFFEKYRLRNVYAVRSKGYNIDANWKLLIENFEECYHCTTIHPLLSKSSAHAVAESVGSLESVEAYEDYCRCWDKESEIGTRFFSEVSPEGSYWFGRYPLTKSYLTQTVSGVPVTGLLGSLKKFDRGISSFRLYPAFYLICNSDYAVSFDFSPVTTDKTNLTVTWYISEKFSLNQTELNTLTEFWEITIEEDNAICEMQQKGISDACFCQMQYVSAEDYSQNFDLWYCSQLELGA